MKLTKNNISKFERLIEEEWNLLQEQSALGGAGYMAGPGGSMSIDGPSTTRFQSAAGGSQDISAAAAHDFFNWMRQDDPSLYMSLQADFDAYWSATHPEEADPAPPKKPNWSMGTPGSKEYHDNLYKAWKDGAFKQSNSGVYGKLDSKIYASADKAPASLKSVTYASKFVAPTKPGELAKITGATAAEIAAAELLDDALTPEPSGMKSKAQWIKNTSAKESDEWFKFIDDEKSAFNGVIDMTPTIRDYYWLNLRVSEATGYNSIIEFLMSFSERRSALASDVDLETWLRGLAYRENIDLALVEIEEEDWNNLLQHLYKLQDSNPEVWNLAHYDTNKNLLSSIEGFDGLKSAISNKLLPLRDHIGLITGKQANIINQKQEIAIRKQFAKNVGGGFAVTQWIIDYLDEDPADALSTFAMIASVFTGYGAMALAAASSAGSVKIKYDNKEFAAAGNEAFWTAVFAVSTALRIPLVKDLRTASKLKIANALAKSDFSALNQIESRVFASIANEAKNPKFQNAVSALMRQRFSNTFKSGLGKQGLEKILYDATTKSQNLIGDILKFVNNSKYFAAGTYLGWNWFTDWWPDIYENVKVPGTDLTFQDAEFSEQVTQIFDDLDAEDIYTKDGKYVGPSDEEALGN